jgi:hypothetical protein
MLVLNYIRLNEEDNDSLVWTKCFHSLLYYHIMTIINHHNKKQNFFAHHNIVFEVYKRLDQLVVVKVVGYLASYMLVGVEF